jgi:hypothetical protein
MNEILNHDVGCSIWVKDEIMEEGFIDLESDIKRCSLPILWSNDLYLVDKRRNLFKKFIFVNLR